jgi:hypothetical protein
MRLRPPPGPPISRARMAAIPVQRARAWFPLRRTLVGGGDDRRAGGQPAPRGHGDLPGAAISRHARAFELRRHESAGPGGGERASWPKLRARRAEFHRRCDASPVGPAARGARRLQGRRDRRSDARKSHPSHRPRRDHPVRAGNSRGATRARHHHPGLDHEILHSRSVAAELARALSDGTGLHGLHGVVEEPGQ